MREGHTSSEEHFSMMEMAGKELRDSLDSASVVEAVATTRI